MTPIMAERLLVQVTGDRTLVSITVETVNRGTYLASTALSTKAGYGSECFADDCSPPQFTHELLRRHKADTN